MSAAGRWRPRVARTSGSVTEAIYGLILAMSVIAVSAEYSSSNAGLVGVTVLVTGVVFWLAHVYARVLAGSVTHHRMLSRSEVRERFATTGRWWRSPFRCCSSSRWVCSTSLPTRQRFWPRRLPPWWNWPLPVHTRRARQEGACARQSRQPSLPGPRQRGRPAQSPRALTAMPLTSPECRADRRSVCGVATRRQ